MASAITVRDLPKEEWATLTDLLTTLNVPVPPAEDSRVVVAEQDGQIIGWWCAIQVVHLEPIWIHPDHRGGTLPARMWKVLLGILDECLVPIAYCFAADEMVANYLSRLGFRLLPYTTFLYLTARERSAMTDLPPPPMD